MRFIVLGCALLAAAVRAESPPPVQLVLPGLQGVNVTPETLSFFTDHVAQHLRVPGLKVVTGTEMAAVVGLERQRALLGCDEGTSCLAELAAALGADGLVLGDVARFDQTFQINLKVVNGSTMQLLAQGSRRVQGQVEALDAVTALAKVLARDTLISLHREPPPEAPSVRSLSWIPLASGVAVGATGGVLRFLAQQDYDALTGTGAPLETTAAERLKNEGNAKYVASAVCIGVGAAAIAAGLGMLIFGGAPESTPQVSMIPTANGATLVLSGAFP